MKLTWKDLLKAVSGIFLLYLGIRYWDHAAGFLRTLLGAAAPILIGGIVAYLVNILMTIYERWYFPRAKHVFFLRSRRPVCMLLAFLTLVAAMVLMVCLILPQLSDCISVIITGLPGFMEAAVDWIITVSQQLDLEVLAPDVLQTLETIDWQSRIGELVKMLTSGIGNVMDVLINAISSVVSGVITTLMSLIFSVYLLGGKETLICQFRRLTGRYLTEKANSSLGYFLHVLNNSFRRYIIGQCTEALILGILCTLGMWIFRLPYASMIGTLVGFTALIPVAGAYIGAGVGAFMILTVDPFKALIFLLFIVILQQLEGNLIYPRVVGSSMGLPGIWVLTAVTISGGIMGIPGMLLGVPLAAALYRIISDDIHSKDASEIITQDPETESTPTKSTE